MVPFVAPLAARGQIILPGPVMRTIAAGGGGGSCPADGSPSFEQDTGNGEQHIGLNTDNWYGGQKNWSDASARDICKLAFKIKTIIGTITTFDYVAEIFTMNVNALNASLGISNVVSGSAMVAGAFSVFTFATPVSLSASTNYGLTIHKTGSTADGSNYIRLSITDGAGGSIAGTFSTWNQAKVEETSQGPQDANMRGYYFA